MITFSRSFFFYQLHWKVMLRLETSQYLRLKDLLFLGLKQKSMDGNTVIYRGTSGLPLFVSHTFIHTFVWQCHGGADDDVAVCM